MQTRQDLGHAYDLVFVFPEEVDFARIMRVLGEEA
jgi:hypothetical protein